MWRSVTRRRVLGGIGALVGLATTGPQIVNADPVDDRYIVDTDSVAPERLRGNPNVTVVHDLTEEIGYMVARAPGRAMRRMGPQARYTQDYRIERGVPQQAAGPVADDVETTADAPVLYDLQWDKREQDVLSVHEEVTGEGARIGVIDDGVLGASRQFDVSHPDLDNVNEELSTAFVPRPQDGGDNFGAGPLADDHGTHVAGTAAASGNNVVGIAPDAEIVDIRVFSGPFATFGDILQAVVYGATVDCDVLNLSLGSGPLLPIAPDEEITDDDDPDDDGPIVPVPADELAGLIAAVRAAGDFAVNNGALPVAAAGNDGVNLDRQFDAGFAGTANGVEFDGSPISLPNEASGFMSVAATGPIGYGWPGTGETVEGLPIESEFDTELRTEEPAFYTNYGADAVDVSAGGGNADIDALDEGLPAFYDLVLSTTFAVPDDDVPQDTQLGNNYTPSYGWKAGTSFAAPNVSGLAALLAAKEDFGPEDIRSRIEETAADIKIGLRADEDTDDEFNGETTAPGQDISITGVLTSGQNVALDGQFDGDDASNPDSVDLTDETYESAVFRGEGHINVSNAVDDS